MVTITSAGAQAIRNAIENAEEFAGTTAAAPGNGKPRLLIEDASPEISVGEISIVLAKDSELFERGVPVKLVRDPVTKAFVAHVMTADGVVLKTHKNSRPYKLKAVQGVLTEVDARVPKYVATMWLDLHGQRNLRSLNGIASVPLLRHDGSMFVTEGYDDITGLWLENMPKLKRMVPKRPTRLEAVRALRTLRDTFQTFAFADAALVEDPQTGSMIVDTGKPPGRDESAFLHALLTAVTRPSLPLAPGVIIRAAATSGAGAGKGLLTRCIVIVAFGHEPHAMTGGNNTEELDKRIGGELMTGRSVLFLDNLNGVTIKSDILASILTESKALHRPLGTSRTVELNTTAFVVLTGNGLTVSGDHARRYMFVELDPRTENPEARLFKNDIRQEVTGRRNELLAAALTIWRWGRQATELNAGRPWGSYEQWSRWVRDPLLALDCLDPAERIKEAKELDYNRQTTAEVFAAIQVHHNDRPFTVKNLNDDVKTIIDPHSKGSQFISAYLQKHSQTRLAGFILTRQSAIGHWGPCTYALKHTDDLRGLRGLQSHGDEPQPASPAGVTSLPAAMTPEPPEVPEVLGTPQDAESIQKPKWTKRG